MPRREMSSATIVLILAILVVIGFILWIAYGTAKSTPPSSTATTQVSYLCEGGKTIEATYLQGAAPASTTPGEPPAPTGSVTIALSDGRNLTLPQTLSASGIRYANADESIIFWSKGNGGFLMENNKETFQDCVALAPATATLPHAYANPHMGFSLLYPDGYTVNESYAYQALGPGKNISGVKFTIPAAAVSGTNLSNDSGISVEEIPQAASCDASLFLDGATSQTVSDGDMTYSYATVTDAAAGNRYEETVYAIPGTNPCVAVRYFIHYGAIENYPAGQVQQFDEAALKAQFDAIRHSLLLL